MTPAPHAFAKRGPVRTLECCVDLEQGVVPIPDGSAYDSLRVQVTWMGEPVGIARICHHGAAVSRLWIEDAIAQQLTAPILDAGLRLGPHVSEALLTADLARYLFTRWERAVHDTPGQKTVRTAAA
jgi:hypothetical protein